MHLVLILLLLSLIMLLVLYTLKKTSYFLSGLIPIIAIVTQQLGIFYAKELEWQWIIRPIIAFRYVTNDRSILYLVVIFFVDRIHLLNVAPYVFVFLEWCIVFAIYFMAMFRKKGGKRVIFLLLSAFSVDLITRLIYSDTGHDFVAIMRSFDGRYIVFNVPDMLIVAMVINFIVVLVTDFNKSLPREPIKT